MAKTLSKNELIKKGFPYIKYEKNGQQFEQVFLLVGACESVIALLKNQGYKVERIQ